MNDEGRKEQSQGTRRNVSHPVTQSPNHPISRSPGLPVPGARVLVLGLGNPILGDDGIGWVIADQVWQRLGDEMIEVDCHPGGGFSLMERLVGYDRVILVDAVNSGTGPVGSLRGCALDELPSRGTGHSVSAHDCSLQTALDMGRRLGIHLPDHVFVVGIETRNIYDFTEELSPPASAAVPAAVEMVLANLH